MKKGLVFAVAIMMALSLGVSSALAAEEPEEINYAEVYEPGVENTTPTGQAAADPYFTETVIGDGISLFSRPVFSSNPVIRLSSPSTGKISVSVTARTTSACEKLGLQSMILQYWTGSSWQTSSSWRNNYYYDATKYTFSKSLSKTSGTRYRLTGIIYAENEDGTTTRSFTTSYITCK